MSGSRRPNILLIMTDQQRFDTLGATGNSVVQTPNIDRLAERGVLFNAHTCSSAICTPSRASLFTGLYPRQHQAWHVGYRLNPELPNLATWLGKAGYRTGVFGKTHWEGQLSRSVADHPADQPYYGFQYHAMTEDMPDGPYTRWLENNHPRSASELWRSTTHEELRDQPLGYRTADDFRAACQASGLSPELQQTAWIAARTEDFISEHDFRKPWFAQCSFVDPHHPWSAHQDYLDRYSLQDIPPPRKRPGDPGPLHPTYGYNYVDGLTDEDYRRMIRSYYAMITQIDDQVGRLLQTLETTGQSKDTIIVFTSDHGDYNGDRGLVRKDCMLNDSLLRVPLIVRTNVAGSEGTQIASPTQHEDIAPTLLELAGLPVPDHVQGISFASLLGDGTHRGTSGVVETPGAVRRYAYFEQLYDAASGKTSYGVSDGRFKYTKLWTGEERFVDVANDPLEYQDDANVDSVAERGDSTAATPPTGKREELRSALLDWMTTCRPGYPIRPVKW